MEHKIIAQSVRKQLKHTWLPFFSRFGRLTDIQRLTTPVILDGGNVIVSAPTASGKTESVVAPTVELIYPADRDRLLLLYIVPTRALANDTYARISEPLAYLEIRTDLKHGDNPSLPKLVPNCLITTPESLDSLLCRQPDIFSSLHTIIFDEIHLLDNTYRGDQLRVLLKRIEKVVRTSKFHTHILSATLSKPEEVAARYGSDFLPISVPGQREIENNFFKTYQDLHTYIRMHKLKKILVFANSRKKVESLANTLARVFRPYPVVAHHGSLSRELRTDAEEVMKDTDAAVCVSTSTLEIGIDIGNIDLVVLADPPISISSLHQRLGRGNRRKQAIQAACLVETQEEEEILSSMFQIARSGIIVDDPYVPDLSVIVQQIFSCLFASSSGWPEEEMVKIMETLGNKDQVCDILAHLEKSELVEQKNGRWYASTKIMDLGISGKIHSNIPDALERMVIDISSGMNVGKIYGIPDSVFLLSGRSWQIVSINQSKVSVKRFQGKASTATFCPRVQHGAFYSFLPNNIK